MALAPGSSLGPYKILSLVGTGGMGEVYRAFDPRLTRDVAVKVISHPLAGDPGQVERFLREARSAAALSHPNVCAVFDVGMSGDFPYLVMELLEGETLREILRSGPLPVRRVLGLAAEIASGLAAAHDLGIIHRDLKPENLFVTSDGRAKVLDFGLAKLIRPDSQIGAGDQTVSAALTERGTILGTVGYMAPEQVRGQGAVAQSDVFAFGAILHEMLTGKRAFSGASFVEVGNSILSSEPSPEIPVGGDVPHALLLVIRRCLEKKSEERFQSARDLAFSIKVIQDVGTLGLSAKGRASPPARTRLLVAAVLAGLLGAMTGAAVALHLKPAVTGVSQQESQRLTLREGVITSARFTPDGTSVVYTASWDGGAPEIFQTPSHTPAERRLDLKQMELLSISNEGQLAVKLGSGTAVGIPSRGTLAVVPLTGGAPRTLLKDVVAADWCPDGKTLVVTRRTGTESTLERSPGKAIYKSASDLRFVRVSPNGKWIAIIENPVIGDTRGSVVILDHSGRVSSRTLEWNSLDQIAWSPDSREVWFNATQGVSKRILALSTAGRLRVVQSVPGGGGILDFARDGRRLQLVGRQRLGITGRESPSSPEHELSWLDNSVPRDISADGELLLFDEVGLGGGNGYATYLRGMNGSPPLRLGEGRGCALSPDKKWVLVIRFGPPSRLVLLPTAEGDSAEVGRGQVSTYSDARWLGDGRRFIFVATEAGHGPRTYLQAVDEQMPKAITPEGTTGIALSPDGRFVAAVSADGELSAWPLEGGIKRKIGTLAPNEQVYQWSGDGRHLWVGARGAPSVMEVSAADGTRVLWKSPGTENPTGFSFLSMAMTPDGRAYAYRYMRTQSTLFVTSDAP